MFVCQNHTSLSLHISQCHVSILFALGVARGFTFAVADDGEGTVSRPLFRKYKFHQLPTSFVNGCSVRSFFSALVSFFLSFFRPLPLEEVRPRCVVVIPSRVCPVTSSFDVFRCNYDCSIGGETPSRQHLAAINAVPVRIRGERERHEGRGGNGTEASPQVEGEEEDLRGVAVEDLDGVGCGGLDGGRD